MADYQHTNGSASYFVTGFLVGGLAAAAATLLIAPKSGKETREQLLRTGIDLGNEALESVDSAVAQVSKKGQALSSEVQDRVSDIKRRGKDILDEQRGQLAAAIAGDNSGTRAGAK